MLPTASAAAAAGRGIACCGLWSNRSGCLSALSYPSHPAPPCSPSPPSPAAEVVTRVGLAETELDLSDSLGASTLPDTLPDRLVWCGSEGVLLFWEGTGALLVSLEGAWRWWDVGSGGAAALVTGGWVDRWVGGRTAGEGEGSWGALDGGEMWAAAAPRPTSPPAHPPTTRPPPSPPFHPNPNPTAPGPVQRWMECVCSPTPPPTSSARSPQR